MQSQKKSEVPLDEALAIAGGGRYTFYIIMTAGLTGFSNLICLQAMSVVMPVAGCELQLSSANRGLINSMSFTGMLFSAQLLGFLTDTFGRRRIMIWSQIAMLLTVVLWSLAPEIISMGLVLFINGLILAGCLTSTYVSVGEYCSSQLRPKAVLAMAAIAATANIYLPGTAWVILPQDIYVPITTNLIFTSWRLYILLITIPVSVSLLLLTKLPETPKFLLSQGKHEETLEILRSIYALNQKKTKEEFPVSSICLDLGDENISNEKDSSAHCISYFKMMMKQIMVLFSKQFAVFTFISCILLFGEAGVCNTLVLWLPELVSSIRHYSKFHEQFHVHICDLMEEGNVDEIQHCQLNFDFLPVGILLGVGEVLSCIIVGLCAHKINKKLFLALCMFLTAGLCFLIVFLTEEYLIIVSHIVSIVILFITFPVVVTIIVELFPTHLRSTSTSIMMSCARLGSSLGNQIMGVLYETHCRTGYFGMTSILVACGVLCIVIPTQKKRN